MGIADDACRALRIQRLQGVDDLLENGFAPGRSQVADMRRDHHTVAEAQGDGILQIGTQRECWFGQREWQVILGGCVSSAEPQGARASGDAAKDGVIGRPSDRPVVMQKCIRDRTQTLFRLITFGEHRFAADVPRSGHERSAIVLAQQMVQRAVGQHHTDLGEVRSDVRCQRRRAPLADQHDGPQRRGQQMLLAGVGFGNFHDAVEPIRPLPWHQYRKRFRWPLFALAQPRDRRFVGRVAEQVIAADTLDGNDGARPQGGQAGGKRRFVTNDLGCPAGAERKAGAAVGAGEGLGMVAAVERVQILGAAIGAECESGHRGVWPIIR